MATVNTANGLGYYLVGADGGVFAFGTAAYYGGLAGTPLVSPVVAIAADPEDGSYTLVEANGAATTFDAAQPGTPVVDTVTGTSAAPIVAAVDTPDGLGTWLVASDGTVLTTGDAGDLGSPAGTPLNAPVVGVDATQDGLGYTLVAADGGVFSYGDSPFYGSTGGDSTPNPRTTDRAPPRRGPTTRDRSTPHAHPGVAQTMTLSR
jgi:hypothetical protein